MGDLCIESVEHSPRPLLQDKSLVEHVDSAEEAIDALSSRIESETPLMMSQQPVASDFRFISSAMRMNTDLERLGDQAYNIGHFCKAASDIGYEKRDLGSIDEMAKIALEMKASPCRRFGKAMQDGAGRRPQGRPGRMPST